MATKKEQLEQSQKALADYLELSKYLLGENAPYDVKDIPTDSPYYSTAKDIVEEMGLDWENLRHEDSVRVMLNLLSEYFFNIKPEDEQYKTILTIKFKKA